MWQYTMQLLLSVLNWEIDCELLIKVLCYDQYISMCKKTYCWWCIIFPGSSTEGWRGRQQRQQKWPAGNERCWRVSFRSTSLNRSNKAGLDVCPSVHKKFFRFERIWFVGRGRWVLHDGMWLFDPIHGQGHGHWGRKLMEMTDLEYLLCQYACNQKANGESWFSKTVSKFFSGQISDISPCSASRDPQSHGAMRIRPAVPCGAYFIKSKLLLLLPHVETMFW